MTDTNPVIERFRKEFGEYRGARPADNRFDAQLRIEAFISTELRNQATELLGEVEKLKEKNDGQCPSYNNPSILGMHHTNTNEHYAFYNKALDDVKKLLTSITSE